MTCEAYQDLVAAHIDSVLTLTERQEAEYHRDSCERCRGLFAQEKRFHAAFAARRFIVPVPVAVERRLRVVLAVEHESQRPLRERLARRLTILFPQPRLALWLAAAGLLIALLSSRLFFPTPELAVFTQNEPD